MCMTVSSHYGYLLNTIHNKRKNVRRRDIRKYVYEHLMLQVFRAVHFDSEIFVVTAAIFTLGLIMRSFYSFHKNLYTVFGCRHLSRRLLVCFWLYWNHHCNNEPTSTCFPKILEYILDLRIQAFRMTYVVAHFRIKLVWVVFNVFTEFFVWKTSIFAATFVLPSELSEWFWWWDEYIKRGWERNKKKHSKREKIA